MPAEELPFRATRIHLTIPLTRSLRGWSEGAIMQSIHALAKKVVFLFVLFSLGKELNWTTRKNHFY